MHITLILTMILEALGFPETCHHLIHGQICDST